MDDIEISKAITWWRAFSNNQMDELQKKYVPWWRSGPTRRMIHEMWVGEGKPLPQELIPVHFRRN